MRQIAAFAVQGRGGVASLFINVYAGGKKSRVDLVKLAQSETNENMNLH